MTRARRWLCLAVGLALMVGVPLTLRAIPPADNDISADDLLAKIAAADTVGYSGYVESLGTLALPVTSNFTDVGSLFGERTRMRVWWRSETSWRVDKLLAAGEIDAFHDQSGTTTWDYERNRAVKTREPRIRLPRTSDLLPPELARLLLIDARTDQIERLDVARVAGIEAPGLRLRPGADQSSVDYVDIWADPETGVPLRVQVTAKRADSPAVSTEFMSVRLEMPDSETVRFGRPEGADVTYERTLDIVDAANRIGIGFPNRRLAGLDSAIGRPLGVGLYGAGVTKLLAVPLSPDVTEDLREQLRRSPGVASLATSDLLMVGPLGIALTRHRSEGLHGTEFDGGGWLLTGTVTRQTLLRAARQINPPFVVILE